MKHLKLEIKDKIAFLEWNQSHSSLNFICQDFIKEFSLILNELDPFQLKALIFFSSKTKCFSAGADIKEIHSCSSKQKLETQLTEINQLFLKFESLNLLKVVIIDGICLGGALELALCFDKILISDSSSTKLAFPEVKLGLIPGFGACLRLPKRVGLIEALNMICSGKSLNPKQALKKGLVDELVPQLLLKQRALELTQDPPFIVAFKKNKKDFIYWRNFLFRHLIAWLVKLKVQKKTQNFYPAPLKAIPLIRAFCFSSFSSQFLEQQNKVFVDLAMAEVAQNLMTLFLQTRKAKKQLSLALSPVQNKKLPTQPIQKVAVLGAGVMGSSIAHCLANKGFEVRLLDNNLKALQLALKKWETYLSQQKHLSLYQKNHKRKSLSVSPQLWGLSRQELVIECLPEKLELKKEMIALVSKKLTSTALFCSNSSSLSLHELSQSCEKPERFFALHFFNPVSHMPLVEICYKESQKEFLSQVPTFIEKLGKIPLIVKDSPGFAVNRVLLSYLLESLLYLEKGADIESLDTLFKKKGFPLGPFETMDKVGLDTCLQVLLNFKEKELDLEYPEEMENIPKILGLGEKDKKGFYLYKEASKPRLLKTPHKKLNPQTALLKKKGFKVEITEEEMFQKIMDKMYETGKFLIKNQIIEDQKSLDMAMILGSGFPSFKGGLAPFSSLNKD